MGVTNLFNYIARNTIRGTKEIIADPGRAFGRMGMSQRGMLTGGYLGAAAVGNLLLNKFEENQRAYYGEERYSQYYGAGASTVRGMGTVASGLLVYGALTGRDPISRLLAEGKYQAGKVQAGLLRGRYEKMLSAARREPLDAMSPTLGRSINKDLSGIHMGPAAGTPGFIGPQVKPRDFGKGKRGKAAKRKFEEEMVEKTKKRAALTEKERLKEIEVAAMNPADKKAYLDMSSPDFIGPKTKGFVKGLPVTSPLRQEASLVEAARVRAEQAYGKVDILRKTPRIGTVYRTAIASAALGYSTGLLGLVLEKGPQIIAGGTAIGVPLGIGYGIHKAKGYLPAAIAGVAGYATYASSSVIKKNMTAEGTITDLSYMNSGGGVSKMNFSTAGLVQALHNANRKY